MRRLTASDPKPWHGPPLSTCNALHLHRPALRTDRCALSLQLEDMEEGSNAPSTPSPNAEREGEDGTYSAWETADVHSPPTTPAPHARHDARHSSDSFSSASTHDTHEGAHEGGEHQPFLFPFGGKDEGGLRGASPLSSPPPPEVDSPPTPGENPEGCASKMLACCNSPYVKGNARVRAFVLALPQVRNRNLRTKNEISAPLMGVIITGFISWRLIICRSHR